MDTVSTLCITGFRMKMHQMRNRKVLKNVACLMVTTVGDYSNRLGDYDLFSGDYWREASNCFANYSHQRASASSWEETVDQGEREEYCANYVGYQEESEYQPACVYDFWSSYQTWTGYGEQEDPFDKGSQGHSYGSELGFCEDIFGYWPCLYQKMPHHVL